MDVGWSRVGSKQSARDVQTCREPISEWTLDEVVVVTRVVRLVFILHKLLVFRLMVKETFAVD